jgi:hypothetical protein
MAQLLRCDNELCTKGPGGRPAEGKGELPYGWLRVERLGPRAVGGALPRQEFCSVACVLTALWPEAANRADFVPPRSPNAASRG